MRYRPGFVFLIGCFSFVSCKEKVFKNEDMDYPAFIESFNEKLKGNSYFGIDSMSEVFQIKDTVLLLDGLTKKSIQYASVVYYVHYDTIRTALVINFHTNLEENEKAYFKEMYLIEKKLDKVSVCIELKNFFCTIVLEDELGDSTFPYLQNIKIKLLEEYIGFFSAKKVDLNQTTRKKRPQLSS